MLKQDAVHACRLEVATLLAAGLNKLLGAQDCLTQTCKVLHSVPCQLHVSRPHASCSKARTSWGAVASPKHGLSNQGLGATPLMDACQAVLQCAIRGLLVPFDSPSMRMRKAVVTCYGVLRTTCRASARMQALSAAYRDPAPGRNMHGTSDEVAKLKEEVSRPQGDFKTGLHNSAKQTESAVSELNMDKIMGLVSELKLYIDKGNTELKMSIAKLAIDNIKDLGELKLCILKAAIDNIKDVGELKLCIQKAARDNMKLHGEAELSSIRLHSEVQLSSIRSHTEVHLSAMRLLSELREAIREAK